MVGVWIEPVTAQVMMTLSAMVNAPLVCSQAAATPIAPAGGRASHRPAARAALADGGQ